MSKSLKDALKQAGLRSTKQENEREKTRGRKVKTSEIHQKTRNFCEHCSNTLPDVERYKHHSPLTDAQWICVPCADRLMIDDQTRVTHQSDMAKKNMFKRYYGATKDFKNELEKGRPVRANRNVDGNRRPNDRKGGPSDRGRRPFKKSGHRKRDT